jgi:hypothetical protein
MTTPRRRLTAHEQLLIALTTGSATAMICAAIFAVRGLHIAAGWSALMSAALAVVVRIVIAQASDMGSDMGDES